MYIRKKFRMGRHATRFNRLGRRTNFGMIWTSFFTWAALRSDAASEGKATRALVANAAGLTTLSAFMGLRFSFSSSKMQRVTKVGSSTLFEMVTVNIKSGTYIKDVGLNIQLRITLYFRDNRVVQIQCSFSGTEQLLSQLIYEIRIEEAIINEEMAEIQSTCIFYLPFAPANIQSKSDHKSSTT